MFFNLLTATTVVAVFASGVTAIVPPDCSRPVYVVKGGDTCDSVARSQHVSSYQLSIINKLKDGCTNLSPGEKLCLARKGQDCQQLRTVTPNDDCYTLAPKGDTGLLRANNPNIGDRCQFVRPGEVVCVADYQIPYTANP